MTARRPRRAVLLAPGAGASSDHHTLVAIEAALAPTPVERFDFPYRLAGRRAPDRPPVLLAAARGAAAGLAARTKVKAEHLVLGGRSMGGRICSMVAAGVGAEEEEDERVARIGGALVLLSYPLHPPGKPTQLRTEHFASLDVPCLFISGDRDAFGTPAELRRAAKKIPGDVTFHFLRGGHDPRNADDEIAEVTRAWLGELSR